MHWWKKSISFRGFVLRLEILIMSGGTGGANHHFFTNFYWKSIIGYYWMWSVSHQTQMPIFSEDDIHWSLSKLTKTALKKLTIEVWFLSRKWIAIPEKHLRKYTRRAMFHWVQKMLRKKHLTCNVSQCFTEFRKSWGKNTWHVMFLNQPKSSFMTAEHSRQRLLTQYLAHKVFKLTTFSWCKLWKDILLSNITLLKIDYWWKPLNFLREGIKTFFYF